MKLELTHMPRSTKDVPPAPSPTGSPASPYSDLPGGGSWWPKYGHGHGAPPLTCSVAMAFSFYLQSKVVCSFILLNVSRVQCINTQKIVLASLCEGGWSYDHT